MARRATGLLPRCSNRAVASRVWWHCRAMKGLEGVYAMTDRASVLVTGAGGFIGHHLVKYLVERNYRVRGVDIKEPEFEQTAADDFVVADLRNYAECLMVTKNIDEIYHLAA